MNKQTQRIEDFVYLLAVTAMTDSPENRLFGSLINSMLEELYVLAWRKGRSEPGQAVYDVYFASDDWDDETIIIHLHERVAARLKGHTHEKTNIR